MLKVHPPLLPCIKFSVMTLGIVLGVVLTLQIVIDLFKGEAFIGFLLVFQLALFFVGLAVALGVFLYIVLLPWAWSVESSGLTGRSYWGRRARIAWGDVDKVAPITVQGIPALVITSARSKREIFAYTLGVNIPEIHKALVRHAGQDHILTQCFRTAAP
jgi:hypothetical protein